MADSGRDLTCRELVELVTDYVEGALSQSERARFERHIAACPGCAAYLDQMQRTIAALGELTEETIDEQVRAGLLHAFRDWHASGSDRSES